MLFFEFFIKKALGKQFLKTQNSTLGVLGIWTIVFKIVPMYEENLKKKKLFDVSTHILF